MATNTAPLLAEVRLEAAKAAVDRRTAAQREIERLRVEASAAATGRRAAALADHERSAARSLEAARAEVSHRTVRETLTARAQALDRIFAQAARHLETLATHPRLAAVVGHAIEDALSYLPSVPVVVRCPAGVVAIARAVLGRSGRTDALVREDPAVLLGAIAETTDGAISVDATLAQRLARRRPQVSIALVRQLEGAPP